MKRTAILLWWNALLAVILVFQLVSGLLPNVIPFPWHRLGGSLLAGGVIGHLILNWPWIRSQLFKR
jgi:hypothetical protein